MFTGIQNGLAFDILLEAGLQYTASNKTRPSRTPGNRIVYSFIPRRLGKHRSVHGACAQADFIEFMP